MSSRQTRVHRLDRQTPDPSAIADAAAVLRQGGLVAFPTETVYGLGANALDAAAVAGIFSAKGRPSTDPLIVHVTDVDGVRAVAREVPPAVAALAHRFWPGPLTIILPRHAAVPRGVTAGLDTVGVRVPAHPVAQALIAAAGVPVAAPSANLFARPSPTRAAHVLADLDGRIDVVLDAGATDVGVESTVLDLTVTPPLVRRPGGVAVEALRALLPDVQVVSQMADATAAQAAPGQLLRHYAPRASLTFITGPCDAARAELLRQLETRIARGCGVALLLPREDADALGAMLAPPLVPGGRPVAVRSYGSRDDVAAAARELFDALRAVDAVGVDEILALAPEPDGLGLAIHDRLTRAAEGRVIAATPVD